MSNNNASNSLVALFEAANRLAVSEIEKYGLPTMLHFELSLTKGREIALEAGADELLVAIGVCLMDVKLGEAFQCGQLAKHVEMSLETGKQLLATFDIDSDTASKLVNCIAAHHGKVPFMCMEAEIVANADCYRFIHPKGVVHYIGTLTKRNPDLAEIVKAAESKLEEKYAILSLDNCRKELEPHYRHFKDIFAACK